MELGSRGALDDIQDDEQNLSANEEVQLHSTDPLASIQLVALALDEARTSEDLESDTPIDHEEANDVLQEDISRIREEPIDLQVNGVGDSLIENEEALVPLGTIHAGQVQEKGKQMVSPGWL